MTTWGTFWTWVTHVRSLRMRLTYSSAGQPFILSSWEGPQPCTKAQISVSQEYSWHSCRVSVSAACRHRGGGRPRQAGPCTPQLQQAPGINALCTRSGATSFPSNMLGHWLNIPFPLKAMAL